MKRMESKAAVMILTVAALFFVGSDVVSGQTPSKPPKGFLVAYDKFKDHTDVSYLSTDYKGLLQSWISFNFDGQSLEKSAQDFYVTFLCTGRCDGYAFRSSTLILLIDGDRESIPSNQLGNLVRFRFSRQLVEKMSKASLVEFQVANYEEVWKKKALDKWSQLLALGTAP